MRVQFIWTGEGLQDAEMVLWQGLYGDDAGRRTAPRRDGDTSGVLVMRRREVGGVTVVRTVSLRRACALARG